MHPDGDTPERTLERYRDYLHLLARLHVDRRLRDRIDLSGVVQTTLFEAHRGFAERRGQGEPQLVAWLQRILAHNLTDEMRKHTAGKRAADRERSLDAALAESSARLEALLAAQQSSPSQQVVREEQAVRLAQALATLPENQRRAVELHHLHGWPLKDIAIELGCSKPAVAGLLHRGLQKLREQLGDAERE